MNEKIPPTNMEQYRRRKRRAGNIRWVLVALFFMCCAACGYLFSMSPFFEVEQVVIIGNKQASPIRLNVLSNIRIGQNIFTVDTAQVERWLMIEPLVESAQVERRLPRTVRITVTERQPAAVLATGLAFIQVDKSGLVLRRMHELDNLLMPILSGVSGFPPGVTPGSRIEGKEMEVALTVLNSLPQQEFNTIKEIDVTDSQKIKLYIEGGIEVRVGGLDDIAEKFLRARGIIYDAQLKGTASNIGYIDISSTEKPVVYYLEE